MIFVTVGTNEAPFDRLLAAVDELQLDERLVVQCGASSIRPARAECSEFLSFSELGARVREARVVVTHAGVGSVAVALANGKQPVVVPRLAAFREAVDDHQQLFARRFAANGQVRLVEDPALLAAALLETDEVRVAPARAATGALAVELRGYIEGLLRPDLGLTATRPR